MLTHIFTCLCSFWEKQADESICQLIHKINLDLTKKKTFRGTKTENLVRSFLLALFLFWRNDNLATKAVSLMTTCRKDSFSLRAILKIWYWQRKGFFHYLNLTFHAPWNICHKFSTRKEHFKHIFKAFLCLNEDFFLSLTEVLFNKSTSEYCCDLKVTKNEATTGKLSESDCSDNCSDI